MPTNTLPSSDQPIMQDYMYIYITITAVTTRNGTAFPVVLLCLLTYTLVAMLTTQVTA